MGHSRVLIKTSSEIFKYLIRKGSGNDKHFSASAFQGKGNSEERKGPRKKGRKDCCESVLKKSSHRGRKKATERPKSVKSKQRPPGTRPVLSRMAPPAPRPVQAFASRTNTKNEERQRSLSLKPVDKKGIRSYDQFL
jgi:hypothetical protein